MRLPLWIPAGWLCLLAPALALATANGSWSNFGAPLPSTPSWPHCKLTYTGDTLWAPSNVGIYQSSLSAPSWSQLASGWSNKMPFRLGLNQLGRPLANPQDSTVSYWNGTTWTKSTFNPAIQSGNWWVGSTANFVVIPETGALLTAGSFTIYQSDDHGASFNKIFNLGTVCPSGGGYGYIYTLERMPWGELFIGGESDTFYHSLDNGKSWSAIPLFNKGGNRFGSVWTKDGEVLLSTAADTSGNVIFRYTRTGELVPAMSGLSAYSFNKSLTYVMNMAYTRSGENFIVPQYEAYFDGLQHVLKWNGSSWQAIEAEPNGPAGDLLADELMSDGTSIYVMTSSARQLKKWTPSTTLPFTVSVGSTLSVGAGSSASMQGTVTPAGTYTWSWAARGPGAVTFSAPSSLSTNATFSVVGDYVLNLRGSNGSVTAGASVIVHYGTNGSGCVAATEIPYDGIDQDCSGSDLTDVDGDGQSASQVGGPDCDDQDPETAVGALEQPDLADNDCDGLIDEGTSLYDDDDDGFTEADQDCNDSNADIYPGAVELPDGIDQDCDALIDENTTLYDDDGDGYSEQNGDCDDHTIQSSPAQSEGPTCDAIDNDCILGADNGLSCHDDDRDGYSELQGDCLDSDATVSPAALEIWYDDFDQDCDGGDDFDQDEDLFPVSEDCDDTDPAVYPGALELADGIDNDCDQQIDESTGGGDGDPETTPTLTPSPTATPTLTPSPTATPTLTPSPTATPTLTPSPTVTPTPTPAPTGTSLPEEPTATPPTTEMASPSPTQVEEQTGTAPPATSSPAVSPAEEEDTSDPPATGCGCSSGPAHPSPAAVLWLLLALPLRRRTPGRRTSQPISRSTPPAL